MYKLAERRCLSDVPGLFSCVLAAASEFHVLATCCCTIAMVC